MERDRQVGRYTSSIDYATKNRCLLVSEAFHIHFSSYPTYISNPKGLPWENLHTRVLHRCFVLIQKDWSHRDDGYHLTFKYSLKYYLISISEPVSECRHRLNLWGRGGRQGQTGKLRWCDVMGNRELRKSHACTVRVVLGNSIGQPKS